MVSIFRNWPGPTTGSAVVMLVLAASLRTSTGFYVRRGWLDDGGTLQDSSFDPPVAERRRSRKLAVPAGLPTAPSAES